MKKILTLAFSLFVLTTVFGQNGHSKDSRDDSRDIASRKSNNRQVYGNNDFRNSFTARERDAQIERINCEFDAKIMSLKKDRSLRNFQRKREIRMLGKERTEQIRQVNQHFLSQRDSYSGDHKEWNNRRGHS